MPDEKAMVARARDYMLELSRGNDPLTGKPLTDVAQLEQERLRRCFAFVAAYLDRELTRAANAEEIYLPTPDQAKSICTDEDIAASEFYERLSRAASAAGKVAVSARRINHFLIRSGVVDARVDSIFVERRALRANEMSEQFGIYEKPRLSPRTGAMTYTLMFTRDTQEWLLRLLPDLAEEQGREGEEDKP